MAIISAQDQGEVAQLENEILGQDLIEGKEVVERRVKVSQTSPSLKHYLVPSPHTVSDLDSKDEHSRQRDMFPKEVGQLFTKSHP